MAEVSGFNVLLQNLAQLDFFTLILPFVLSFIIFKFVLNGIKVFSENEAFNDGNYDVLISLILSSFVVYFLSQNPMYQSFFTSYFGRIAFAVTGALGLLVLFAFIGVDLTDSVPIISFLGILAIIAAFSLSGGFAPFIPGGSLPLLTLTYDELFSLMFDTGLVYLLVIGLGVYFVTKEGQERDGSTPKNTLDYLLNLDNDEGNT